jgi:hypothetical protein
MVVVNMKDGIWEFKHMVMGVEVNFFDLIVICINCILLSLAAVFFTMNWVSPVVELDSEPTDNASEDMTSPTFKPITEVKPLPKTTTATTKPRRSAHHRRN